MNALSRGLMDAYYLGVETLVRPLCRHRPAVLCLARALGFLRTWVGYVGPRKSRGIFLAHMEVAAPHLTPRQRHSLLRSFWYYHQLRFLDLFTVALRSREELSSLIRYEGLHHLDAALDRGRGALVVTLHWGDPRVAHVALGLKGYPVHLLSARYDDYGPRAREARLRASRKYHEVHFLDEPLRWAYRELEANHVVFLAISGYGGPKGHPTRFLNAEIVFSSAPARLALDTGAPVVPLLDRFEDGLHAIRVLEPLDPPTSRADMPAFTKSLVTRFEEVVSSDLAQLDWIWFVIRCQERRGEILAYEEGKVLRAKRLGGRS